MIKPITAKARPRGENVIDLMEALRQSVGAKGKKMRKASARQKEMLMPIEGKKLAKQAVKKTTKSQRRSA
jgi:DNA end-binding protein Ku